MLTSVLPSPHLPLRPSELSQSTLNGSEGQAGTLAPARNRGCSAGVGHIAGMSPRRRGGQPGNLNARKHGFYSARLPHPEAALFHQPPVQVPRLPFDRDPASFRPLLENGIQQNRLRVLALFDLAHASPDTRTYRALIDRLLRTTSVISRLGRALYKCDYDRLLLRKLLRDLPLLVGREFAQLGIPPVPIFVPLKLNNFDMNSSHGGPVLTDPQWFILEGTLQSLRQELGSFRAYRSHKPGPSPRLLLEGILFKLGFGLRWADLPRLFGSIHPELPPFPLRTAQRLYRQLYLSGRMAAIYERLHEHLASYGESSLQDLIESGTFALVRSRVCLVSGRQLTWDVFTALLLLQRAFHNRRALLRDLTAARLSRRGYRRLPFKRPGSSPVATADRASRPAGGTSCKGGMSCKGGTSCKDRDVGAVGRVGAKRRIETKRPIETRPGSTSPPEPLLPLESSPVWQKWQATLSQGLPLDPPSHKPP